MGLFNNIYNITIRSLQKLSLTLMFLLLNVQLFAQLYPFKVTTTVQPPYTTFLSDYFAPGSGKLTANVAFNDFNETSWDFKLKLTIRSSNIIIQSDPNMAATPITIYPGQPLILNDQNLAQYFDYNNLLYQGITKQQILQNGKLPDGQYQFCFEVLDYKTGVSLSLESCQYIFIQSIDEPTTITPVCASSVVPSAQQNIMFQWQLSNALTPSQLANTEYELKVYEVTDNTINPMLALANNKALLVHSVSNIQQTSYFYDMSAPPLDLGKKYVYQVRAIDITGRDAFKNNGYSQVCWFSYGYASGGNIVLVKPDNNSGFGRSDQPYFKWNAPDNIQPGQQYNYILRIVKLNQNQSAQDGISYNTVWEEEITNPTTMPDWSLVLGRNIDPMEDFGWQVKAFSGTQEIAQSEVRKFRGPGVVDKFYAGNHIVYVNSTLNADINNLSGNGKFRFGQDSSWMEVDFQNIDLDEVAGLFVLNNGNITKALVNYEVELNPDNAVNGNATFYASGLKLNKDRLALQGIVKWHFPHAVMGMAEAPKVISQNAWVNFDTFKLNGVALLNDSNDFNLADPLNFRLKLKTNSEFLLSDNKFFLKFNGEFYLPQIIKAQEQPAERVMVPFNLASQLYYINVTGPQINNSVNLIPQSQVCMRPLNLTIDLSETESPEKLSADKPWKGLYFGSYKIYYKKDLENSKQLILKNDFTQDITLTAATEKCWISPTGLQFHLQKNYAAADEADFNTFKGKLTTLDLDIENSNISGSTVKGTIKVPLFSNTESLAYTIPLTDDGFEDGYLDISLTNRAVVFNDDKPDVKVTMTVKQAVFADRERLDMVADFAYHKINATCSNVPHLKLWGNNDIGFEKKNGVIPLTDQAMGLIDNKFETIIDSIGIGYLYSTYGVVFKASLVVADDVTGADGPPRTNFASVEKYEIAGAQSGPSEYENTTPSGQDNFMATTSAAGGDAESSDNPGDSFKIVSFIYVNTGTTEFKGYMEYMRNDPDWGNCFRLATQIKLKQPFELDIAGKFVMGEIDDYDYWFVGIRGEGLKVKVGFVELNAIEGRVYHHMNHEEEGGVAEDDYIPHPNISYGAFLAVGMADAATSGEVAELELSIEAMGNESGGLQSLGIQVDLSLFNIPAGPDTVKLMKGTGILYYNIPDQHFLGSISVVAPSEGTVGPVCAQGTLFLDYSPSYWQFGLGGPEPDDRVKITPGCFGFGAFGWLVVDAESADVGMGISWGGRVEGPSIDIVVYEVTPFCFVNLEIGVAATFEWKPTFQINTAKIWILFEAGIGLDYENAFDSGTWWLARVSLGGEVTMRFNPKPVNVAGSLYGEIEVIGVSADFSLDADINL